MLKLPEDVRINRNRAAERTLLDYTHKWLAQEERDPRLHVSDLLNPRLAYWKRVKPAKKLSDRLAVMFLVGKVLHAFVLSAVEKQKGTDWSTDTGSEYSEELDIVYSMDAFKNGIPRELKTSRSLYEPRTTTDLQTYLEQLLSYSAAKRTTNGQLWILYLNLKDDVGRTAPAFRCYDVDATKAGMRKFVQQMLATKDALADALKRKDPSALPLCQQFMCGKYCEWWSVCKPPHRYQYGTNRKKWTDGPQDLLIQIERS